MIRVAIELNHVVRNINKQILKYYHKDIDMSLDLDDINENDDVFKYCKFDSMADKNSFIYIDYPYEIFGCAKPMSKDLPMLFNNWLSNLTNYEDDDIEVFFYSLNEEYLTIQSTYFFLSKIGTRVRKVIFPKEIEQIKDEMDVIITTNKDVLEKVGENVYKILINTGFNSDGYTYADKVFDSLENVLSDETVLNLWHNFVENKNKNEDKTDE